MGLRAADRVLVEAAVFKALDFEALFEGTNAVPWESLVPAELGLKVVKVRSNRSQLKAETSIQSIVHKAAAERLCKANGLARLPETGREAELRVHIEKDMVSLLLDLSGEPLFKRGYRKEGGVAPLRETTAAAMLLLSGWKRKYPLFDPFCGSGTILAEALMYAWDMAPGLGRNFALDNLSIADKKIEETVRDEFRSKINFERAIRIAGSDEDHAAVKLATANLERVMALAEKQQTEYALPKIFTLPMKEARPPFPAEALPHPQPCGFIVTNPPYGKRLGDPAASERIYGEMPALGRNFPKWKLAVITDHPGYESFFCKKADSCREITSGPNPAYFFQYEQL
jgi:putative N6-adenine-specific DNA methylase